MVKILRVYKTEINPTKEQADKIRQTIGVCRFIYNLYLVENKRRYENGEKFFSYVDFSRWLNHNYLKENPDKLWIKDVSTKSVTHSVINANTAFKNFFKGLSKYPRFKKKDKSDVKMYFVRNSAKEIIECERHRIKIPSLGWVRLKEKGYIPTNHNTHIIKSGTVSYKAGRYYVSVLVEEMQLQKEKLNDFGIGIDLGLKEFAVLSNERIYNNINKTQKIKKLEKKLKREQRSFSRMYESYKKSNVRDETCTKSNYEKQKLKVQRLYHKLNNIRTDYINKCISEIVRTKPSYIAIEDLNVSGMMKNKHLSKAIRQQKFYEFRTKLTAKCKELGIELRVVDRFYPSSKTCHNCGCVKHDLKLSERVYKCPECGFTIDRDLNAALNLRDFKIYKVVL